MLDHTNTKQILQALYGRTPTGRIIPTVTDSDLQEIAESLNVPDYEVGDVLSALIAKNDNPCVNCIHRSSRYQLASHPKDVMCRSCSRVVFTTDNFSKDPLDIRSIVADCVPELLKPSLQKYWET